MNRFQYLTQKSLCALGRFIDGEPIWERDWDILCVLDGCRVDTFRGVFDDTADEMVSVASTSQTWLPRTFDGRDLESVGYVTGNPFATQLQPSRFAEFHIEPVTETEHGIETVPPRPLTDRAIDVWRRREELGVEKLIVHFMQPHIPFRSRPEWFSKFRESDVWGSKVWKQIPNSSLSKEEVFEACRDNLEWVLGPGGVETLQENCDGTIALTADHGNAAGEFGLYGHPEGAPIPQVRHVPWATVDGVDERTREPVVEERAESVDVENQLEALGYRS